MIAIEKLWEKKETNPNLIVSFSLFGKKIKYTNGAIHNVQLGKLVYPNWTFRFYVDHTVTQRIIQRLLNEGAQVYIVKTNFDDYDLMAKAMFRFLPAMENVRFICRDADSRVNVKEAWATDEWIKSGKSFTRLFDFPYNLPVLAGMWGGVSSLDALIPNIDKLILKWVKIKTNSRNSDEFFLAKHIYPLMKKSEAVYGNASCMYKKEKGECNDCNIGIQYPFKLDSYYIGEVMYMRKLGWKKEEWNIFLEKISLTEEEEKERKELNEYYKLNHI